MRLRPPPGRAGRLWLARRLATARRGAEVLDEKRRALLREQTRLQAVVALAAGEREAAAQEADAWLERALLVGGRRALSLASSYVPALADLRLSWRSALGVLYPDEARVELPSSPCLIAPGGGSALPLATAAHGRAVEAAARYAAARVALDRVTEELQATTRRLRAVQRRWIPAHERALAALDLALDEAEREEAVRRRWVRERRRREWEGAPPPGVGRP